MSAFIIGPEADLGQIEMVCWIYNQRRVANELLGGHLPDAQTGDMVDISTLTDFQINDRDRFPLPVVAEDSARAGVTQRWDVPHPITKADSPYLGSYYMPLPAVNRPYDAETTELLLQLWASVMVGFPAVSEIEAGIADLVEPPTEQE